MKLIIKHLFILLSISSITLKLFAIEDKISGKNFIINKNSNMRNNLFFIPFGTSLYLLRDNSGKVMSIKVDQKNNYKLNYERDKR